MQLFLGFDAARAYIDQIPSGPRHVSKPSDYGLNRTAGNGISLEGLQ
jgi:hypothetical protein